MDLNTKTQDIIEIRNLNKTFGTVKAVQDLSFKVKKGELFAFLGVNGAGKSTTISIMCGQLTKDSGSVTICGKKIEGSLGDVSRKLGVVFQNSVLDQSISVRDNLRSRAALYGITGKAFDERLNELAELLDFSDLFQERSASFRAVREDASTSQGLSSTSPKSSFSTSRQRDLIRRRESFCGTS